MTSTEPTDQQPTGQQSGSKRKAWLIAAGVVAVVGIVAVIGLVWYLNQPVPDEVSLDAAVAGVQDETTTTAAANDEGATTTQASSAAPDGIDGTWTIDTTIGEFSFEEATASFVGFRIDEVLGSIGETQAVGRTPDVAGTLTVDGTLITDGIIEADLTTIVTNASRRDNAVQRALNTSEFPIATFELVEPIDLGAVPQDGESFAVTGVGALTINGITQPVEVPLEGQVSGDLVIVVGSVDITFADWDVAVPESPAVVSVEDHGPLELQLIFTRS
ncbi:MAG: YceI family protein [Acidimicrobiia bacterium]